MQPPLPARASRAQLSSFARVAAALRAGSPLRLRARFPAALARARPPARRPRDSRGRAASRSQRLRVRGAAGASERASSGRSSGQRPSQVTYLGATGSREGEDARAGVGRKDPRAEEPPFLPLPWLAAPAARSALARAWQCPGIPGAWRGRGAGAEGAERGRAKLRGELSGSGRRLCSGQGSFFPGEPGQ